MHIAKVDFAMSDAPIKFIQSMRESGFAIIVNHPIRDTMVMDIYREWNEFFSSEQKWLYTHSEKRPDGYYPFEENHTTPGFRRDRKEFYHIYHWGVYPPEVSNAALRYFEQAHALGIAIANWIDAGVPSEVSNRFAKPLAEMLSEADGSVLRVQHYLPVPEDEPQAGVRAIEHTDINLLTLLAAPSESGLQIRDAKSDAWLDVPCDSGSLVVNGGEMLEQISCGYFPATPHRVVYPKLGEGRGSRFSLPLFFQLPEDAVIGRGMTAGQFRRARVAELARRGWKVVAGGPDNDASAPTRSVE